jgi:hypothetical protein
MIALDVHSTTKLLAIRNRPPFNRPPFNPVNRPLKRKFIQEKSVSPVKKVKSNITKKSRK